MQSDTKFLDILRGIGNEIPKLSTDFITPDGIDFKKMKSSLMNASFNSFLPACTLVTDLMMQLLEDSKNRGLKEFVGFARNAMALYSIMDTVHANIVPSNSMENRHDIMFWKDIGARFGIDIPMCDSYGAGCTSDVPVTDILFYLAFKLAIRKEVKDVDPNYKRAQFNYRILGVSGDAPTMASTGAIDMTSDATVLLHCTGIYRDTGKVIGEMYYCMQISRPSYKDIGVGAPSMAKSSTDIVSGGKVISEHCAFVKNEPGFDPSRCIKAVLCSMYRGLDSSRYHYFADWNHLTIRPNTDIRCTDEDAWVKSKTLERVTEECDRVTEANMTRSYALVGPPGTGKTSTCEHIMLDLANRGYTIIRCTMTERYLESNLDRIMTAINMCSKSVVLLDDLDSLDISVKCSEVNLLIDFFARVQRTGNPVIVFSTVNNPRNIHSTLMGRSGRIDEVLLVDYPDAEMTEALLQKYFSKNEYTIDAEDCRAAAEELAGKQVSVADIKNLASMMLFKHGKKDHYTYEELKLAIDALMSSREAAKQNYCRDDEV